MMDSNFMDAYGSPLEVGSVVAWGVGGDWNYGIAVGKVTKLEVRDVEVVRYNSKTKERKKHIEKQSFITVKPLEKGRKGRTERLFDPSSGSPYAYGFKVAVIQNQKFGSEGL
ncbi:MAG: hypothetical protein JJ891_06900 [Rhizobiaceae bacterium]|nr:hypothetical protein [Rhizobiaceae bacterium]